VPDNLFSLIFQFTIDPGTGVLTPSTPSTVPTGNGPTAVAVDPSTRFAYAVNRLDNTVSMYSINGSNGTLTQSGTVATGTEPFRITFDPSGKFVYVVNEQGAVSIYTVNSNGSLLNVGSTGLTTGAVTIGVTPAK
jgi:6-phosphogluconolactonase